MRTLEDVEYRETWDAFYKAFKFQPSVSGPFPSIVEPPKSITFRLLDQYEDIAIDELREAIFHSFSVALGSDEEIYYLDWQHECFSIKLDSPPLWVTGYPDGDYAILLAKDMQSGTFAHPWEASICFFGDAFVNALLTKLPSILEREIRSKGGYVVQV